MKITRVLAAQEDMELARPYRVAFKTFTHATNIIVRIDTDQGIFGLGAAAPEEFVTGENLEACKDALATLQWLEGSRDPDFRVLRTQAKEKMNKTPAARAAVDMALYDIEAKIKGIPLVKMLGQCHTALPTSITIGIKSVPEILNDAEEYLSRGFTAIKLKLGTTVDEDIERTARLRDKVGKDIRIRVDHNQGYNRKQLLEYFQRSKGLNVEFYEQPLPAKDIEGMRSCSDKIKDYLMADESLVTEEDADKLLAPPPACHLFNIKLMKCGGPSSGLEIAKKAGSRGIGVMWGCMDESRISISAALAAAFASPATKYLDLDGSLDLKRDVVRGGFTLKDGVMRLTDAPGIGVELI
jgi:L-alanine-DL-glutamate epimerase-like enolase superfamily enzyme